MVMTGIHKKMNVYETNTYYQICLSNFDNQTSALNNLGGYLRRICLAEDYGA